MNPKLTVGRLTIVVGVIALGIAYLQLAASRHYVPYSPAGSALTAVACPARPSMPYLKGTRGFDHIEIDGQSETNYGDERYFVTIQRNRDSTRDFTATVKPGDEITVWLYVDNGADPRIRNSTALETTTRITLHSFAHGRQWLLRGFVDAKNANPRIVSADAVVKSKQSFALEPIAGSG